MNKDIIQLSSDYIKELFSQQLSPDLRYHDVAHTDSVIKVALELANHYQLSPEEKELLEIACIFHDSGYVKVYTGHEEVSQEIAANFLQKHQYPADKIEVIKALIGATRLITPPTNLSEEIIKDADLNNLGTRKYMKTIANLRYEFATFLGKESSTKDWYNTNLQFIDSHDYYTDYAKQLFDKKKKSNRKKVKTALRELIAPLTKKKRKNKGINGNRSAQMMFKTALRNHIDLTSIADNKANIMLSVNALIITITISLLGSKIDSNGHLILPAIVLLTTSVISIIYATLATRPIKSKGLTDLANIQKGPTNLFFYGNFYKMPFKNYKAGIRTVIQDDDKLDDSITADLYFLGKALGIKFARLRTCYNVFAIGLTLTAIAFAISYFMIPVK